MEHGSGEHRALVQNGLAWRAWRRADHVLAGRIFPWRAGAGAAWICAAEHHASSPADDRRYKSCRRVTRGDQVPRSQPANCRCGGGRRPGSEAWLPQALVHSCRQERRREHDGKAIARLRLRRARCGNSPPQPPTKSGLHCCTWWRGRNRTAYMGFWNGLAQRSPQYTAAGCCGRSVQPCSAMKPKCA